MGHPPDELTLNFGSGERAERMDFAGDAARLAVAGGFQIVARLKIDPKFRSSAEKASETESRVGSDGAATVDDFRHAGDGNAELRREAIHAESQRTQEFFAKNLAGVNGLQFCGYFSNLSGNQQFRRRTRCRRAMQSIIAIRYSRNGNSRSLTAIRTLRGWVRDDSKGRKQRRGEILRLREKRYAQDDTQKQKAQARADLKVGATFSGVWGGPSRRRGIGRWI